jgi:tetratricopeptide (TPR) repeat protein
MFAPRWLTAVPWRWRLLLIGSCTVLIAACSLAVWVHSESVVRNQATTARRALARGQLDAAKTALDCWLKSRPEAAEAHYLKAQLAWAGLELDTANQELSRAQQLGYPPAAMAGLRGLLLARTGHIAEAEPVLRQAFDGSSRLDPEVADTLAHLYLGTFQMSLATEVLERWRRELPEDARPYLLQTEIDLRNRTMSELVIEHFRSALQYDPDLDRARLGLADQLRLNHRNTEANDEYQAYLTRKPDDPMGYLGIGLNALELGDEAGAVNFLDRALALAPKDPVILGARATVEIRCNRPVHALLYLDRAVQCDPFDQANHYQRMLSLTRLGRKAEAEAERRLMDQLRTEQDQFAEIQRGLERNPLDLDLRRRAARWLMEHGHEEEAIDWANLVLHSVPADPTMNRLLADYFRKKGKLGLANFHETHASASPESHSSSKH